MADRPPYWFLISDPFHKFFYRTTATVSIISNLILIVTIRVTASSRVDNYRYLLLCFAVGDMISSLSHSWISPIVHLTEHGFFFFPKHANELKSENAMLGKAAVLFYVMTYYETFNVLAFHFIYRYMMIVQGRLQEWTRNWRLVHWVAAAIAFMIVHSTLMVWAMQFSSVTNEYSLSLDSTPFINLYGVNTSDPTVGYVVIEIRRLNPVTGLEEYDAKTLVTFAVIMSGFGLSGNVMVVCSVFIIQALSSMTVSSASKVQQRLLFRALLVQTLVPCIFSYAPLCVIWLWPLFTGIALGPLGNLLIMSSVMFPSIDAIMIIIFIPAYRQSMVAFIRSKFCAGGTQQAVVPVSAFTASSVSTSALTTASAVTSMDTHTVDTQNMDVSTN